MLENKLKITLKVAQVFNTEQIFALSSLSTHMDSVSVLGV